MVGILPGVKEKNIGYNREEQMSPQERVARDKWSAKTKAELDEAKSKIDSCTKQALCLLKEASELADETGVYFSFDVAYGMGGTYSPETKFDGNDDYSDRGWCASSRGC